MNLKCDYGMNSTLASGGCGAFVTKPSGISSWENKLANRNYTFSSRSGSQDCAFFIQNKPAYALEKGDQLSPLDLDLNNYFFVLVMPQVQVSTAEAYGGVRVSQNDMPLTELIKLPIAKWKFHIKNDFEPSVFSKYPVIAQIKDSLYESGALYASMSGSGSSVYGIFNEPTKLPQLEKDNKVFYVAN